MTPAVKLAARLLAAVCACVLLLPSPASASTTAATAAPCWKTLINDWYDGRIDNVYPIPCYQAAISHLPTDIKEYSSAADDIRRALQLAINYKAHPKTAPKPYVKASVPASGSTTTTTTTTTAAAGSSSGPSGTAGATSPGNKPAPGIPTALKNSSPGGATSFPLPLIILGGLALFLLAAGAVGLIIRRMQSRGPGGPAGA